jgi:Arc/MetJ-type ribon-helix-helix transcriptional regulator
MAIGEMLVKSLQGFANLSISATIRQYGTESFIQDRVAWGASSLMTEINSKGPHDCAKFDDIQDIILNIMSSSNLVRTTLALPADLLSSIDEIAKQGRVKSRNEFVDRAIRRELAWQKRQEIDAALTEMAQDPEYQATVRQMEAEFATASWEALATEAT